MQIVGESTLLNAPLHVFAYIPALTRTQLLCPCAVTSLCSHPHPHPHPQDRSVFYFSFWSSIPLYFKINFNFRGIGISR
jgi:hypothetical protein